MKTTKAKKAANILRERNQQTSAKPPKAEKPETSKLNGTTYTTFASELD
ncbi:hypothetical protein JTE90_009864, partial [Oedothorax gibbosus]